MPSPETGGEWGVLGGSFDPVHNGHINLAEKICQTKSLLGVLFIPAFIHPFKKESTEAPYSDRVNMLKLALKNKLRLCEIEKELNLSGYTIDTWRALKKRFSKADFYFIIGLDLVKQLKDWHRSDELMKEARFLAGSRPEADVELSKDMPMKNVEIIKLKELDISASAIRKQIKNGAAIDDIKQFVPMSVAKYIFEKGLYQ